MYQLIANNTYLAPPDSYHLVTDVNILLTDV